MGGVVKGLSDGFLVGWDGVCSCSFETSIRYEVGGVTAELLLAPVAG